MNATLLGILAYVLAQFAIGIYLSRRIRTEDDYLVAGRSLGYGLGTLTIFATWFGAETCIGAAGAIYASGLSGGVSDPFGYGLCLILMGLVFAVPLWRRRLTTLGDLFRQRFGSAVERLAVVLMIPTSLLWAAAQIRAFGQVLTASTGLAIAGTVTLAAAVVIAYTVFGGMLADAWTDMVQGIVLIAGLGALLVMVVAEVGTETLSTLQPFRPGPEGAAAPSALAILEEWAIPLCGSVLAAELVSRVIATRSPQVARRSSLMGGGVYLAVGMIPVLIGLLGFQLLPGLAEPEQVLPLMAQRFLPPALYILFAGALVSAILSTVDSALLVAGSLLSHNLVVPSFPGISERGKVRVARGGVMLFGVLAYLLALRADWIYGLVEEASAFGSAGIFVVIVFGLFTRFGGGVTATATLLTGMAAWVVGAYLLELDTPYLVSLAAALGVYLAVGVLDRRGEGFPAPVVAP